MSRIISLFATSGLLLAMVACGGNSTPPPPPVLTVSPSSASVSLSGSQAFSVTNATGTVTWSISPQIGSINANGIYLAPSSFPTTNSVTVTATIAGKSGTATALVVYPNDNSLHQSGAIKLGTSGGDEANETTTPTSATCCIGTLGSLITRAGTLFMLSNNHVLGKSDAGTIGLTDVIDQPGQRACFPTFTDVGTTAERAALKPTSNSTTGPCQNSGAPLCGHAPSNVDAAIASIVPGAVDPSGTILDLGTAGPTSIGDAPPSSTLATGVIAGTPVAKSGRTTGLTCSTVLSTNTTLTVDYDASCAGPVAFAAFFNNQILVNGGTFSAGGDSGSLIVTQNNAQPVALLYAGNNTSTAANPIADVLAAFSGTNPATIVGGADHPVSCEPTSSVQSTQVGAQSTPVSAQQHQAAINAHDRNADSLMAADSAIRSVEAGASSDSPGDGALVIEVSGTPKAPIPPVLDGVRTRVVYVQGATAPSITLQDVNRTAVIKQSHEQSIMAEKGIQGVGVGRSDDNPAETAIVIFTIQGEPHPPIPAVIDGVRTKIVEGDRFRAFGWNSQLEPKATACAKRKLKIKTKLADATKKTTRKTKKTTIQVIHNKLPTNPN